MKCFLPGSDIQLSTEQVIQRTVRQIARFSEWQSTREGVFALAKISLKAAVEGAQKRFSFGTPGTR
jgi:hypothetical protein